jgi:hypothetical protein
MAAGIATLTTLTPALHARIEKRTSALVEGLQKIASELDVPFTADCAGSMWGFFFRSKPVRNFSDAKASDVELFKKFFHAALQRGVYLAPSPFEACFMSAAHTDQDISSALEKMRDARSRRCIARCHFDRRSHWPRRYSLVSVPASRCPRSAALRLVPCQPSALVCNRALVDSADSPRGSWGYRNHWAAR